MTEDGIPDEGEMKDADDDDDAGPDDEADTAFSSLPADAQRVLHGDMEDLPPMPSNTVRIFLSSTFSGLFTSFSILHFQENNQIF